jgi:hypothetical protein
MKAYAEEALVHLGDRDDETLAVDRVRLPVSP